MEKLKPHLEKLKGLLDHLEKVLLGAALIAVAFFCVSKLFQARVLIQDTKKNADDPIRLSGGMYGGGEDKLKESQDALRKRLDNLVVEASGNPKPLVLDGTNHMVFNPRKWKEIIITTNKDPVLVPDSVKEPLGVSALQVTRIVPVRLIVTPIARLALNRAKVLYRFEQMDYYPMVFRQLPPQYGPISTFLPHLPQAQKIDRRLTRVEKRGPVELHWWYNQSRAIQNNVRLYHPDWIVKIDFKNATPTPPQFAANIPQAFVDSVRFDLDIIYRTPGGQVITQPYKNVQSKSPIAIIRAYQADFLFRTKYHAAKNFNEFREGRHLMMDGEALRIFKITRDEVHLVSDLAFGGNGKLYIKTLGAAAPVAPAAVARAPARPPQPAPAPKGPGGSQ